MGPSVADTLFWIAALTCAVAQAAILRGVVTEPPAGEEAGFPASPRPKAGLGRRTAEGAWSMLPGLVLAFVLVWTWRTMHHDARGTAPIEVQTMPPGSHT